MEGKVMMTENRNKAYINMRNHNKNPFLCSEYTPPKNCFFLQMFILHLFLCGSCYIEVHRRIHFK